MVNNSSLELSIEKSKKKKKIVQSKTGLVFLSQKEDKAF